MNGKNFAHETRKSFNTQEHLSEAIKRNNTMRNIMPFDKSQDVDEISNKSLDSLLQDSGESIDTSPNSLGSSFCMERLNLLT